MSTKMSTFIITLLLICIPIICFGVAYTMGASSYGVDYNDTISGFNQYAKINATLKEMNTELHNETTSSGGFNIIGDYLGYGKRILFLALDSTALFTSISNAGYDNIASNVPDDDNGQGTTALLAVKFIIIAIVMIAVFFIIIAYLSGRQEA